MEITITDTFKVKVDTHNNHQPVWFDEGGKEITFGKNTGEMSKPKWVTEDKYFNNVTRAIHWGVENGHLSLQDAVDECTLEEYIQRLESIYERTTELLRGVK